MITSINRIIIFTGCLLCCTPLLSQLSISGPACAVPGVTYQYSISNTGKWAADATMKVCIEGGIIADEVQSKRKSCTETDAPLSSVLVIWNELSKASITVSSSAGSKTFSVTITEELQAGTINNKKQNLRDSVYTPSAIQCSAVRGGSCSPFYIYQWQQSPDALVWTDISDATGQDLSFILPQKQTSYYRRQVIEKNSGTIGYSDIAAVNVALKIPGDTSAAVADSAGIGTIQFKPATDNFLAYQPITVQYKGKFFSSMLLNDRKQLMRTEKLKDNHYKYF
jgi:hypothetical protein